MDSSSGSHTPRTHGGGLHFVEDAIHQAEESLHNRALANRLRRRTWPVAAAVHLRQRATRHAFQAVTSVKTRERQLQAVKDEKDWGIDLHPIYLGLAAVYTPQGHLEVGIAMHDGTYSIDFSVQTLSVTKPVSPPGEGNGSGSGVSTPNIEGVDIDLALGDYIVNVVRDYMDKHGAKFIGAGITRVLHAACPRLPSRLWADHDIVAMVFQRGVDRGEFEWEDAVPEPSTVDEQADSMARKSLMFFGPNLAPRVQVGYRNRVLVDVGGDAIISRMEQYQEGVHEHTWTALMHYIDSLKGRKIRIAFFNSTPQGGGVALMRHALVRFFRVMGIQCDWYVPKPKPEVFRITKTNHNILQGVAEPHERLTSDHIDVLDEWAQTNAERYWVGKDRPLAAPADGGHDIVVVDDPQMPSLVKLAKSIAPDRPVIFRSHIQVRADLADTKGTPTSEVWNWVWNNIKGADVFISHPVREFVPASVPTEMVGYMPATTDWLDGLNKHMNVFDSKYYIHELNTECFRQRMTKLDYPRRPYITQIARFDPAKGIPDVLASYALLRRKYLPRDFPADKVPQLVLAGHGAVDDPDASRIYDETLSALDQDYPDVKDDVVVLRIPPVDQILNAVMAHASVALQLSTREGFEVKVSEALHHEVPIIATRAGGIPLQVADGTAGYLVDVGDIVAVAKHLASLITDDSKRRTMSEEAAKSVSDEVGTVGNALAWVYLADTLSKGETIQPNLQWINDLAREGAGVPYGPDERRLPRVASLRSKSPVVSVGGPRRVQSESV